MLTETKIFAIHDVMTLVSMMVQRLVPETLQEELILSRAGYREIDNYFFFSTFRDEMGEFTYDVYKLENQRSFGTAARYIKQNWDELESGELIDIEYILGEIDEDQITRFEDEFTF